MSAINVPGTPEQTLGINLYNPLYLPNWRVAAGTARTTSTRPLVICLGDSTTAGLWGNGAATGNQTPYTYPTQLGQLLTSAGIPCQTQSFSGFGQPSWDSRITTASWASSPYTTVGGPFLYATSSGAGTFKFLPTTTVDTFVIYWFGGSGNGTFNYAINNGSTTGVSTNTSGYTYTTTVSTTLGTNTLDITWASGGYVYLCGVRAYNSTIPGVDIMQAGWSGSTSSWWQTSPLANYSVYGPALTILNLGINDWNTAVGVSTFTTNMQALITQIKASANGDLILCTPNPTQVAGTVPLATQKGYVNALYTLASSNGLPLIDLFNGRFVTWELASSYGLMGDIYHPKGCGYSDIALALSKVLTV